MWSCGIIGWIATRICQVAVNRMFLFSNKVVALKRVTDSCSFRFFCSKYRIQYIRNSSNMITKSKLQVVIVGPKNDNALYADLSKLNNLGQIKSVEDAYIDLSCQPNILSIGSTFEELTENGCDISSGNVILNVTGNKTTLPKIIENMPALFWLHSCFAGLDHILYPALINSEITVTNAKGCYSSSLAEYVMSVSLSFAKDLPRLMRQKQDCVWGRYCVGELRGKTMGIIGYGDIGQACAKLAKAFGMNVIGTRSRPELSQGDEHIDEVCVW